MSREVLIRAEVNDDLSFEYVACLGFYDNDMLANRVKNAMNGVSNKDNDQEDE